MMMTKQQQVILASAAAATMFLQGCSDSDDGNCEGLAETALVDSEGKLYPSVVFNWRILYDRSTASSVDASGCLSCVENNLGNEDDPVADVVNAFVEECGSPAIDVSAVAALSASIDTTGTAASATITFTPPGATPSNVCGDFPNDTPEDWVTFCTDNPSAANTACCNCAIARLNWTTPSQSGTSNKLGSGSASISNCPANDDPFCGAGEVSSGCGFTALTRGASDTSNCEYADAKQAFMDCGSGKWPNDEPEGFTLP